jgi:hypothetical protein
MKLLTEKQRSVTTAQAEFRMIDWAELRLEKSSGRTAGAKFRNNWHGRVKKQASTGLVKKIKNALLRYEYQLLMSYMIFKSVL